MTDFIGKRVRLVISRDEPPKDDPGTVIGQDTTVHVRPEDLQKYGKVVGEEVILQVGCDVNTHVNKIIDELQDSEEPYKDKAIELAKEILKVCDISQRKGKIEKFAQFVTKNIASAVIQAGVTVLLKLCC
ncbi:MAG: hypothetical protein JW837_07930 [Sedimentisphaerales bacterium]|nr:hypothetical protein [Sedimentisphaerales bacterium]